MFGDLPPPGPRAGWRGPINRLRRWLAHTLLFRMGFGQHSADGRWRPHTRVSPSTCIEHPERLQLGDHVFIGHFNFIEASGGVCIDEGVQVTNYVSIVTHSSHVALRLMGRQYVAPHAQRPGWVAGGVRIGAYSYIGPHSLIEAGSRIGKGCVVASYSAVRGEFPDFSLIRGNPAQRVGDSREADARRLAEDPAWAEHYRAWAGAMPAEGLAAMSSEAAVVPVASGPHSPHEDPG